MDMFFFSTVFISCPSLRKCSKNLDLHSVYFQLLFVNTQAIIESWCDVPFKISLMVLNGKIGTVLQSACTPTLIPWNFISGGHLKQFIYTDNLDEAHFIDVSWKTSKSFDKIWKYLKGCDSHDSTNACISRNKRRTFREFVMMLYV